MRNGLKKSIHSNKILIKMKKMQLNQMENIEAGACSVWAGIGFTLGVAAIVIGSGGTAVALLAYGGAVAGLIDACDK
jgi:hypothetical protein